MKFYIKDYIPTDLYSNDFGGKVIEFEVYFSTIDNDEPGAWDSFSLLIANPEGLSGYYEKLLDSTKLESFLVEKIYVMKTIDLGKVYSFVKENYNKFYDEMLYNYEN